MPKSYGLVLLISIAVGSAPAQTPATGDFKLALPSHSGQLRWHADGFKVVEASAKPNGREIGLRGQDASGKVNFLGFLFLFPERAPLSSAKCRDGVMDPEKKSNPALTILASSEIVQASGPPVALTSYTSRGRDGKTAYMVRGFVASGVLCGDLEFYSDSAIGAEDDAIKRVFAGYHLDLDYSPQFGDSFLYGEILYHHGMYQAAAPVLEQALGRIKEDEGPEPQKMRRVVTDHAGMAYGISGDIAKARAIFEKAIASDPDYPLYYYNLACADAQEKKLVDAQTHLQQAFARKANVIAGETMPDPTKDDSFLPYRNNENFWKFIESLR